MFNVCVYGRLNALNFWFNEIYLYTTARLRDYIALCASPINLDFYTVGAEKNYTARRVIQLFSISFECSVSIRVYRFFVYFFHSRLINHWCDRHHHYRHHSHRLFIFIKILFLFRFLMCCDCFGSSLLCSLVSVLFVYVFISFYIIFSFHVFSDESKYRAF